jgi:hypothetical protein
VFGKTRDGLCLNCLDIDSDSVYSMLFSSSSFINDSLEHTFVVKAEKKNGFHIYWLSHRPNKAIHKHDCKPGYELEIKTDKSSGTATLPPSNHRDNRSFSYQFYSKSNSICIMDDLYDKLIAELADCLVSKDAIDNSKKSSSKEVELNHDDIKTIVDAISPYYLKNNRNDLIFALSGLFRRFSISFDSALNVIQQLVKDDEEKRSRINTLDQTYRKKPMDVCGTKYFVSVIENIIGPAEKAKVRDVVNLVRAIIARSKKIDTIMALEILEQHKFATLEKTGEVLYYEKGVYHYGGEVVIRKIIENDYIDHARINLRREVLDHIRCLTYQPLDAFDADINITLKLVLIRDFSLGKDMSS